MSDQRMIGDILFERRKRLGLSLERVCADTKLQRRTLEAFERSDFDAMPPKGYAQATLASYARYLGLEPTDVLRVYEGQLYHHQRERVSAARPDRSRGQYAPPRPERASRGRSSARTSDSFTLEEEARQRADDLYASTRRRDALYDSDASRSSARPYGYEGTRSPSSAVRRGSAERPSRDERAVAARDSREGAYASRSSREFRDVRETRDGRETRVPRRTAGVVTLDDGYEGGSGGRAHEGFARGRVAREETSRDQMAEVRAALKGAFVGIADYLRMNRSASFVVASVAALLIIVLIVFAVTSCASRSGGASGDGTIPVSTVGASASQDGSSSSTAASQAADGAQAPASQQAAQQQASSEPLASGIDLNNLPFSSTVTFTVDAAAVTSPWVEVTVDGARVYAQTAAPGTTETYTVGASAVITVNAPDSVSFTVNGTPVQATVSNGTGTLSVSVAADQQGMVAAPETQQAAAEAPAEETIDKTAQAPAEETAGEATAYTGDHQADVAGSVQVLYDENGQGYYLDANGDMNYYYDDGTPVT